MHNRLLTLMLFDVGSFAGLAPLLGSAIAAVRKDDPLEVPHMGACTASRLSEMRPLAAPPDRRPMLAAARTLNEFVDDQPDQSHSHQK